jgi:four helix bundle protein
MGKDKPAYDLEERLLAHAVQIVRLIDKLPDTPAGQHVAGQLLRCGTSPYPHHGEAQAAESADDFIHKMKVCLKELKETIRWLKLAQAVPLIQPSEVFHPLIDETDQLIKIFAKSIQTAERGRDA